MDSMLGNFSESCFERYEKLVEIEAYLVSERLQRESSQEGENCSSHSNTNTSEKSEITAETITAINSKFSSQMSKNLEEVRIDLKAYVLEVINHAIEEKVLSTIQNALKAPAPSEVLVQNWTFGQMDVTEVKMAE